METSTTEKKANCAMCKFTLGFSVFVFLLTLVFTFFLKVVTPPEVATSNPATVESASTETTTPE